ncbi:MAG: ATP-binding protein [bacterium]
MMQGGVDGEMRKTGNRDFKRRSSLFIKIFFLMAGLGIGISIPSIFIFMTHEMKQVKGILTENNKLIAELTSVNVQSGYFSQQWPFGFLKKIKDNKNIIYWRVVKPDGEIYLADDAEVWGKRIDDEAVATGTILMKEDVLPKTGEKIGVIVTPLDIRENGRQWTFWLGYSLKPILVARRKALFIGLGVVLAVIILTTSFAYYFSKGITRPVRQLVKGTKAISKGNLNYMIRTDSRDEVGELANSFNRMARDLKRTTISKDYFNNIIRSMIDTLVVLDGEEKIKMVNQATLELLQYRKEEMIGKPASILFAEGERVFRREKLGELIKSGKIRNFNTTYLTKSGEKIPVSFSGSVMRNPKGEIEGIIGVAKDIKKTQKLISELKVANLELTRNKDAMLNMLEDLDESYRELKTLHSQLLQVEKMSVVGRLAAGVAHEINNPLSGVLGFAQVLLQEIPEGNGWRRDVKKIEEAGRRCKKIVSNLLTFSRQQDFNLEFADIGEVIDSTLSLCENQILLEKVRIIRQYGENLPKLRISIPQIEQVFINLITNAIQAMPQGGEIKISTGLGNGGDSVEISFADTGKGIKKENLPQIFEPFFTTREVGKGTGLGLSVSYEILKKHNGNIRAESEGEGMGACFRVILPVEKKGYEI